MKASAKQQQEGYDPDFVEKVGTLTFSETRTFYRDTNLDFVAESKYKPGLVIQEIGFADVSCLEGGLIGTTRYHIVTNQYLQFKASFGMYGASTLPRGCFFKVLEVIVRAEGNLVTLLHIDAIMVAYFATHVHPKEAKVAEMSRLRFEEALRMPTNPALDDSYWLKRTAFPLGIDDRGKHFFRFDYGDQYWLDPLYRRKCFWERIRLSCLCRKSRRAS
jgi:hypothetical protein